eukprot:2793437-Pyramimonas_sp.AAC.1
MFSEPKNVPRTTTLLSERKPDVLKQNHLNQRCSKNSPWKPPKVLRTLFGRAIGEPGRFATA